MSTYDDRLAALDTVIKQDIIRKLDETNTVVPAIQGSVKAQGRDLKFLINQVKSLESQMRSLDAQARNLDIRLTGAEMHLDRLSGDVSAIQEQQNVQGQDIRDIKLHLEGFNQRFVSLEEKFDQRFDQVLQALATLTNKP